MHRAQATTHAMQGGSKLKETSLPCGPQHKKIEQGTQMSWFLYWQNLLEEDERKAFGKWLVIEDRAAKILQYHKSEA